MQIIHKLMHSLHLNTTFKEIIVTNGGFVVFDRCAKCGKKTNNELIDHIAVHCSPSSDLSESSPALPN